MAYNKKNLLRKIIKMQNEYLHWQEVGLTPGVIYKDKIRDQFDISRSTYYRWLAINAKAKLKAKKREEQEQKDTQTKLFND